MNRDADAQDNRNPSQTALAEGYGQMSADVEHEAEAEEWVETLIGDSFGVNQESAP